MASSYGYLDDRVLGCIGESSGLRALLERAVCRWRGSVRGQLRGQVSDLVGLSVRLLDLETTGHDTVSVSGGCMVWVLE